MGRKPSAKTAEYHHGDLARALVEAAVVVLEERGVAGLSLREVARRAGVSHAAPAHHFGDKAGLLTAVAIDGFRRFSLALSEAYERAADPLAGLIATGHAYVRFAVEHRAHFELMFRPEHYRANDEALRATAEAGHQVLLKAIVASQEQGHFPSADPRDVALSCWCNVHGLATLWLDGNLQHEAGMSLEETIARVLGRMPGGEG